MKKLLTLLLGFVFLFTFVACDINEEETTPTFYVSETMNYDDIDVTVNSITGELNQNTKSDYYGLLKLTVNFTCKNNSNGEFELSASDFYIKTEDKGEKYDAYSFSGEKGLFDFGDSIIAGATKIYDIEFYVSHMLEENKKYIMYLDWGILHNEQEYKLYYRDGTNAITKADSSNNNTDSNENQTDYSYLFYGSCPISIRVMYFTSDQTLSITHTNQSGKTITAIKYLIIVYDAYGEELKKYGYGASALTATYDNWNTSPGGRNTGDWKLNGFDSGKSIDIYIYSVLFTDNTEYGYRNLTVNDIKSYAPKNHIVGRYA